MLEYYRCKMNQVDRLLINLKIIASLEPYQKLNTKSGHQLVIESAWSSTSFYRWMREDTRHNTVKRIGEILEEANNILNVGSSLSKEYVSEEYRGRVMAQLQGTRVGMVNLRITYESDPTITAHFDVLLERMAPARLHVDRRHRLWRRRVQRAERGALHEAAVAG